jgi:hypothetical protein
MPEYTVGGRPLSQLSPVDQAVQRELFARYERDAAGPLVELATGIAPSSPSDSPTSGVGPTILLSIRSFNSLTKSLFFHAPATGGRGDELQIGELPNGQPREGYMVVDDPIGGRRFIMIPMWEADP